ncbi:MAG TPA: hypothetical protein VGL93_14470 [Streptosporangiaceae bacterium]|jgi:thymidylate kinase
MKPLFIALEGLSCSGKTTVVGEVADALGAGHLPTIPDEYSVLRRCFDQVDELDARFLCYLSAICRASRDIGRQLDAGRSVVVESYLARTVAFHRGMGSSAMVYLPELRQPDVSFHLTCAPAERHRRELGRGGSRHFWDELAAKHEADILCEYRRFPLHQIDTTARVPRDVVDEILRHPLDGSCACEDTKPVAGHQDLLSALSR